MPTKKELKKQLRELRRVVEENESKHLSIENKTKWTDSKWGIRIQVTIAICALLIAGLQAYVGIKQYDTSNWQASISEKQSEFQAFEIIKGLSQVSPNDTFRIDNLFSFIDELDETSQVSFLENSMKSKSVDYFSYKATDYFYKNIASDTAVYHSRNVLVKVFTYLDKRVNSFNDINLGSELDNPLLWKDLEDAYFDIDISILWLALLIYKMDAYSFEDFKKVMNNDELKRSFKNTVILQNFISLRDGTPIHKRSISQVWDDKYSEKIDPSGLDLSPQERRTFLFDSFLFRYYMRTYFAFGPHSDQKMKIWQLLNKNFRQEKLETYHLYLQSSESLDEFNHYLPVLEQILSQQDSAIVHDPLFRSQTKQKPFMFGNTTPERFVTGRLLLTLDKIEEFKTAYLKSQNH